MSQQSERLRQSPCGKSIGRETAVYQGQPTGKVIVGQVGKIVPQLQGGEHSLVDNILGREGDDVEIVARGDVGTTYLVFNPLADDVQLTVGRLTLGESCDENLLDVWFGCQCRFAQYLGTGRHIAQVHQGESLFFNLFIDDTQNGGLVFFILGQEEQTGTVASLLWNGNALQQDEFMRNLQHDAGTVTGLVVGSFGTSVAHVLQHFQRRLHQVV